MRRCMLVLLIIDAMGSLSAADTGPQLDRVSYARDVAPILARHCLECHGPDAHAREAGLRLDLHESATTVLDSGHVAVVAGDPASSELVRRISAGDADRMPPSDSGDQLTDQEVATLVAWIESGASWETHWAFVPPRRTPMPQVKDRSWVATPVDRFILAELDRNGKNPLPMADRRTLIRRVYFDLVGLPPTPDEVAEFHADSRPDAWERLVDRLLASPLYGQRWGRHWLDVARYGDSNGGDENHAYPLAWRYRDYVIGAFNDDVAFDAFVHEQIAGDLLAPSTSSSPVEPEFSNAMLTVDRQRERLTATGFLALGTKILAEKDTDKMRADLVDEQIDTLGKTFLGLTIGCARCHDHKFDPIPTADYYALAGIFQSTQLGEQPLVTRDWELRKAAFDERLAVLNAESSRLQEQLTGATADVIERQAEKFDRGNVVAVSEGYGEGIGIISDPGAQDNFAEYDIEVHKSTKYLVQLRYAAETARPGRMLLNGKIVRERAIAAVTGGWMPPDQRWFSEGVHEFQPGINVLRIESAPMMSHIDRIRLIQWNEEDAVADILERLDQLDREIAETSANPPQAIMVMASRDGEARDSRIHLRGSHLSLGDKVARGFPDVVSAVHRDAQAGQSDFSISDSGSGRLQLAHWMTDADAGAGGHTARVVANRLWHWHFGRGLVATPDDFGMRGQPPTHPRLLDWMAVELMDSEWSLKSLHRQILLSATYRQCGERDSNPWYAGVPRRRLEAEVIRDSLLFHAERLDLALVDQPLAVKTQDPSPEDLQRNEELYHHSQRRSVFLPVVRSNVYSFLTLFDFPNAATPVGRRDETIVPTQALLIMNDPFVMQQAAALARIVLDLQNVHTDGQRLEVLYQRLFSRSPTPEEQASTVEFLTAFEATVDHHAALRETAWASLCQTLMASSEFIYVE